jgi:hypothetical protein
VFACVCVCVCGMFFGSPTGLIYLRIPAALALAQFIISRRRSKCFEYWSLAFPVLLDVARSFYCCCAELRLGIVDYNWWTAFVCPDEHWGCALLGR